MSDINKLIHSLQQGMPSLDTAPLYHTLPADNQQLTVLEWLYQHLSQQQLMVYEEWNEFCGEVPELKPLSGVHVPDDAVDFIFELVEKIDWSTATLDPYSISYVIPWLACINFYLKGSGWRLVHLLPFENGYIFCLRDDDKVIDALEESLQWCDMGINRCEALDHQQAKEEIAELIYGQ
jgi:hypothetical protein